MSPRRSKVRNSVLAFAEAHPQEASYLSARELGKRCGASEATVIRAVQSSGFSGYPKFQEKVRLDLARRRTTVERLAASKSADPLSKAFSTDMENLKATWEGLPREAFDRAVGLLLGAPRVWVLGLRMAHALSYLLADGLVFLGINARILGPGHGNLWDEAVEVRPEDVVVAASLPRYTRLTVEIAASAHGRGASVIAITDGPFSPLAATSDVLLPVAYRLEGYVESFTAAVSLVQALLLAIAREKGPKGLAALKEKEALWAEKKVYWE